MQKTQVGSLGWEDPLEKEMAVHSRILAWEIPQIVEHGGLQSMGLQEVGHDLATEHAEVIMVMENGGAFACRCFTLSKGTHDIIAMVWL